MNLQKFFHFLCSPTSIWPEIDYELIDLKERGLLRGRVLNAGCGWRDISHLVEGELVNQDLKYENDTRNNVHIYSSLESIPVADEYFDAVISVAVMEHVQNPDKVMEEMTRVLAPGGALIMSIPFLQPEHKAPTDFQRYTRDGIIWLCQKHGLEVTEAKTLHSVYHTIYWIAQIYLEVIGGLSSRILHRTFLRIIGALAVSSDLSSERIASGFRVVAIK